MAKREYGGAFCPDIPPDEPPWDECTPFFLAKELDRLPLDTMGPVVTMRDPFNPEFEIICANPYHNNIERIGSFKQFLMGRYYSDYISFLKTKIEEGTLKIEKRSAIVPHPDTVLVSEAEVQRIDLYRKSVEEVYADIILSAKIFVASESDGVSRTDYLTQWYRIRTCSNLNQENLSFNEVICILVYDRSEPIPGVALDEYLIPYTSATLLDYECTGILDAYFPEALDSPHRVDGEVLAERMGLQVTLCRLLEATEIRGQIYFEEHEVTIQDDDGMVVVRSVPANTILVNTKLCLVEDGELDMDKLNDTIVHECYHAYRHRLFYLGQRLYNSELRCLTCTIVGNQIGAMLDDDLELQEKNMPGDLLCAANSEYRRTPIDWMEWQSNRATPRIRMPARTTETKIEELLSQYRKRYPGISSPRLYTKVIYALSAFYGVSKQSAKKRMIELGYHDAQGVLNYVNGKYAIDYSFSVGSLRNNQTFTIGLDAAITLYQRDKAFRECINSGLYQYVDDHFCRSSAKYIYRRDNNLHLTSYARTHMDECCLVFTLRSVGPNYRYHEGVLLKEVGIGKTVAEFDPRNTGADYFQSAKHLSAIINELPRSPSGTLKAHMSRTKMTVDALVAKSGVSEKTIRRLRADPEYIPTKSSVIAICIGLQLEPVLQRDWMSKLGIIFTANTTDVFYELLMASLYKQPLSVFNQILREQGFPPLSRCEEELDS